MKSYLNLILVLLFLFLSGNSCKKESETESAADISGKWIWLSSWTLSPPSNTNPSTSENSGVTEVLTLKPDLTWLKIRNNIRVDSGTYSTGHGSYLPYIGATKFIYDSVVYYRKGVSDKTAYDYYKIYNDTLQFCSGFAGISGGGSKFYINENKMLR